MQNFKFLDAILIQVLQYFCLYSVYSCILLYLKDNGFLTSESSSNVFSSSNDVIELIEAIELVGDPRSRRLQNTFRNYFEKEPYV